MSDTALYRKYRPQAFKDVVGQDHIISVLKGSIEQGKISHAYLFSGSRGTGKTSIARIFAKGIGTSENDLYEIDAASNRGIDDIREIRDGVNMLPLESPYKVYLIDEVHMLTKEAFNALLKTLEEPPQHVVFILATTETDKLPETVVSRCQTFSFKKPSQKMLKDMVMKVAKKEGYTLEASSADLIAFLGDGSFRDTLGMLQKVISSTKDTDITREEVERVTGAPKSKLINDFVAAIDTANPSLGFGAIQKASEQNIDMGTFLKLVLHKIRAVLLLRFSPDLKSTLEEEYSGEDFALLQDIAGKKESKINSKTILELLKAEEQLKYSPIATLPLELALAELTAEKKSA